VSIPNSLEPISTTPEARYLLYKKNLTSNDVKIKKPKRRTCIIERKTLRHLKCICTSIPHFLTIVKLYRSSYVDILCVQRIILTDILVEF